jgi:hypothetical protein
MHSLLAAWSDCRKEYIFTELALALTLCKTARLVRGHSQRRALLLAYKAYRRADRFMWRAPLSHDAFNGMTAKLERLRFELTAQVERLQFKI